MKYPTIHISAKEAATCHDLCQDLANILAELAEQRVEQGNDRPGYSARRNEIANNGIIFIDVIRNKLNEIRGELTPEAGCHAPQDG